MLKKDILRQSYARLILEALKADKVIASNEINEINRIFEREGIMEEEAGLSSKITLADACKNISESKKASRNLLKDLHKLSTSDGYCSREEAMLLTCLSLCLDSEHKQLYSIVSYPCGDTDFEDSQVLFIESGLDRDINDEINDSFDTISNELRLGGFEFVYIPVIAKHYKYTNENLLQSIINLLSPTLLKDDTKKVIDTLKNLSTRSFISEILEPKLKIKVDVMQPSFMFKIGNSWVNGVKHSDFLIMNIPQQKNALSAKGNTNTISRKAPKYDILPNIQNFLSILNSYQYNITITINNTRQYHGNFIYTGFHKTLIDMVLHEHGKRDCIILTHTEKGVYSLGFRGKRVQLKEQLNPTWSSLYLLIISESLSERNGIKFINGNKEEIDKKYFRIHKNFSNRTSEPGSIMENSRRLPMLSNLEKSLGRHHTFRIRKLRNKLSVAIDPGLIIVKDSNGETPATEHPDWKDVFK